MRREHYEFLISSLENQQTIKSIGKIDIETIRKNNLESLYYLLPLIERITLEIYKSTPLSNVEKYKQGEMRNILDLLNSNSKEIVGTENYDLLEKIYAKDGIRNKIIHPYLYTGSKNIQVNYEQIKKLLYNLIVKLKSLYDIQSQYKYKKIEQLK